MDLMNNGYSHWYITSMSDNWFAVARKTPNGIEYNKDSHNKIIYCKFQDIAQMLADFLNNKEEL